MVRDFCTSRSLFMVPFSPTCHTHTSDTLLDLCFLSDEEVLRSYSQTSAPFIAGHDLISVTLQVSMPSPPRKSIRARSFRNFQPHLFEQDLGNRDWSSLVNLDSVDTGLHCLQVNTSAVLDVHAPYTTCVLKPSKPPWLTPELDELTRTRDSLYRVYRRARTHVALFRYRDARDQLHSRITRIRADYLLNRLSGIEDSRALWNELRALGIAPDRSNDYGDFAVDDLNRHFAAVSQRPSSTVEVDDFFKSLPPPRYDDALFYFSDISPVEFLKALGHFTSQARGMDDLSLRDIKLALPVLFPHILALFNCSLSTATFPDFWKHARILPLGKVKSPTSLQQVRPISILCFLSKVLERIVLLQLSAYLEDRNLLDSRQSGFRPGFSTQTALLRLTEDVRRAVDGRRLTLLVLFDFSKAFDTIPHAILLRKLLELGLSQHALRWVASYLQGRSQAVVGSDGELSSWANLDLGVPQGSVLGPLLFSLFANDISGVLEHCSHLVYADDLQIYLHFHPADIVDAVARMNSDVEAVLCWSRRSELRLNVAKTHVMVLGSNSYVSRLESENLPKVFLDGSPLPFVDSIRDLGLMLDNKLSWKDHVNSISNRVHGTLRQLSASRRLLDPALRKKLVVTLVFPIFDYCSVAFCDLSGVLDSKLQRLLNTCVRFVCGVARDEHISPFRRRLGWLTAKDRRLYFLLATFFNVTRSGRPAYLRELIVDYVPTRSVSARRPTPDFALPSVRTEAFNNSFAVLGVRAWESLPVALREVPSLVSFKHGLYKYLFDTEYSRL